ncbi:MAG: polymerase sigma-70 factor, subfamily [Candidatus Poribacteria bacterium]|nr:polymerase sigma-70 factor, subfamily [Candidatus Poribacteria bacterium]
MQKDDFLVQQTLAGEHEAFHRLIILYQADVYALVMSWVKNPEDAKELVQDIFLEAYRDLASLKQPERFYFWLRQIAKHRCQNWQERKRQFVPLSEDIVAETPSADETLILRETLAKMMQAIDELPETEKQLIKERYLDDSSYAELQAKHGLSYKALNMRLLRAREKVRESVKKALAGFGILTFRYSAEDILTKGVVAVKISLKVKIITIGVATVLILSGTGVIVWNHQSTQDTLNISNQTLQQASQGSQGKLLPVKKAVNKPISKSIEKSKEEIDNVNVSEKADQSKETVLQKTVESVETGSAEDLVQRYDKYMNSQESMDWSAKEIRPFSIERERFTKQAELLKQERNSLEDKLATASSEERDKIQKELNRVQAEYMEAKTNQSQYQILTMDAIDRGRLRYFTPDELSEIFRLKAVASPPPPELPPPSRRDSEEFIQASAEAGRRLKTSGFVPNPILAKALFWE